MNSARLLRFFETRREREEPMVLVSVAETSGSTYSKAGDQMLIDANGVACGMLSGGCLESDLAARAQVVLESGKPQSVTYNLAADDDVWGLGIGCDGSMTLALATIEARDDYAAFERPRPLQLLVLGAGLDAVPLTRIATEIGWQCTIYDHRPASIDNAAFPADARKQCAEAGQLSTRLSLDDYDAAVVMSHNLDNDRSYLRQLAATSIGYVGLLGPAARKTRLLQELGVEGESLSGRLHGPAGLDLGGRGPEPIALSIVAQIQERLAGS